MDHLTELGYTFEYLDFKTHSGVVILLNGVKQEYHASGVGTDKEQNIKDVKNLLIKTLEMKARWSLITLVK